MSRRYDVDDVPARAHYQIRGGWGILAPQIFGIASYTPPTEFSDRAACAGAGDYFFPETGNAAQAQWARRICAGCPIKDECLEWALEHGELLYGIWGGTGPRQRQWISARREEARRSEIEHPR